MTDAVKLASEVSVHFGALNSRIDLEKFTALIVEECATVCDERARRNFPWTSENSDIYHAQATWAKQCAADIRALVQK